MARNLISCGRYDEAVQKFSEAIAKAKAHEYKDHNFVAMLGDYGELLQERGDFPASSTLFQQALQAAE